MIVVAQRTVVEILVVKGQQIEEDLLVILSLIGQIVDREDMTDLADILNGFIAQLA